MSFDPQRASVAQHVISAEAAAQAVAAAVAHASTLGVRINAAVVDGGGTLAAFLRMPGAFLHSVEIAIDKAYTAASFGFPTAQWPAVFGSDELLRIGLSQRPRLVVIGGGLPIRIQGPECPEVGALIGGIGVSGASAEQDEACALAGLRAIGLST